ncbi:MAG: hypothetical protein K6B70_01190 [Clostridia bacterium]|nr:hypothetical protein [Clostridia bacterium]
MNAKETIEQVLRLLETVDFNTTTKAILNSNSKKVHKAYEMLFELNKRL